MINEWTDAMKRYFAELHRQTPELSFSKMAAEMSAKFGIELTRSACIGKASRMRLPQRGNRQQMQRVPRPRKVTMIKIRIDAPIAPVEARLPDLRLKAGLTLIQLRDGDCHWPLGEARERPPYLYCGDPALLGRPYCKHHTARAYNTPNKRWE